MNLLSLQCLHLHTKIEIVPFHCSTLIHPRNAHPIDVVFLEYNFHTHSTAHRYFVNDHEVD